MALQTVTISASGTWKVPGHVPGSLKVIVVGGGGGDFDPANSTFTNLGGLGGYIRGDLTATPGTTLTVNIGGRGADGNYNVSSPPAGGTGARPGGDGGVYGSDSSGALHCGAGGGGGTELKLGSTTLAVAGGGGGGATKATATAGSRAGNGAVQAGSGSNGTPASATNLDGQGGRGATTSAVGAGGAAATGNPTSMKGADGVASTGGAGASYTQATGSAGRGGGGGGGGGYFGAGGGGGSRFNTYAGRGGGGSSWSNSSYITEGTVGSTLTVPSSNVAGYVMFEYEPAPFGGRRGLGLIRG